MAEHVRGCEDCRSLRDCKEAEAIIAAYPAEILADAFLNGQKPERNIEAGRTYQREYMRRYRASQSAKGKP